MNGWRARLLVGVLLVLASPAVVWFGLRVAVQLGDEQSTPFPYTAAKVAGTACAIAGAALIVSALVTWARRADAGDTPTTPPLPPMDTPAGWYPNPDGPGRRFWDGAGWTSDTAP